MPSFQRLTVEEARTLNRAELLPRIEQEQKYWYHRIQHCQMQPGDDKDFRTFNDIMHIVVNPLRALTDTGPGYWTKPLGELGEL